MSPAGTAAPAVPAVTPVIDPAARFGRVRTQVSRRTCIVILTIDEQVTRHDVWTIVDAVDEALETASADIAPEPSFGAKIRTEFIAGRGKVNGKFVIILALGKLLSLEEIEQAAKISAA